MSFLITLVWFYPKSHRHHLFVGQTNLAKCKIYLETNSTHVSSTRVVLEVGGEEKWALMELSFKKVTTNAWEHYRSLGFFRFFFGSNLAPLWSNHILKIQGVELSPSHEDNSWWESVEKVESVKKSWKTWKLAKLPKFWEITNS